MVKIGDKVRFLSETGGGTVTGFQGKNIVLVEDADGFDIPMPINECVVIETDDYNIPTPAARRSNGLQSLHRLRCIRRLPKQHTVWHPGGWMLLRNRSSPSIGSRR